MFRKILPQHGLYIRRLRQNSSGWPSLSVDSSLTISRTNVSQCRQCSHIFLPFWPLCPPYLWLIKYIYRITKTKFMMHVYVVKNVKKASDRLNIVRVTVNTRPLFTVKQTYLYWLFSYRTLDQKEYDYKASVHINLFLWRQRDSRARLPWR